MHKEILSSEQIDILPLIKMFSDRFVLIGGTAIALHLGHRKSIDFDLITFDTLDSNLIRRVVRNEYTIQSVLVDSIEELTLIANNVKLSFINYPFHIDSSSNFQDVVKLPDLPTLAATKAFALGRRAKWKDYVDLYFIIKKYSFDEVVSKTKEIFKNEFNEKLFREQISYFEDIDYTEKVDFMDEFSVSNEEIRSYLQKISISKKENGDTSE